MILAAPKRQEAMVVNPLATTLARLRHLDERLQATVAPSERGEWFAPASFFEEPRFSALQQKMEQRYGMRGGPSIAAKLLSRYQWGILVTAIGCYLHDGRVPHLDAAGLCLRWNREDVYVEAVAYGSRRFTALAGDAAAGRPGVCVVHGRDALRDCLRREIEDHFAPVIETLCARVGSNPRSLWPTVADRCASTLLWLGPAAARLGMFDGSTVQEVEALVNAPGSPLHNKATGVLPVTCGGETHFFLKRAACCHAYRRDGRDYCDTCPCFTAEERVARLRARVLREAGGTE